MSPRSILGDEWWDKERVQAYRKFYNHCQACGVHRSDALYYRSLEAHEVFHFNYPKGRLKLRGIVGICHACHNYIHDGRMENLAHVGLFDEDKRQAILRRGEEILRSAGYSEFKIEDDQLTPKWQDWHIVVEGKSYFTRYKSLNEWHEYFSYVNKNKLKDTPELWDRWKKDIST
jgi:hypothetical protein